MIIIILAIVIAWIFIQILKGKEMGSSILQNKELKGRNKRRMINWDVY